MTSCSTRRRLSNAPSPALARSTPPRASASPPTTRGRTPPLAEALQRMVGFRNIAVHQYQALQVPILIRILETHLDEFTVFSSLMLRASAED